MIDQGEALSPPEQTAKADADLATFTTIDSFAKSNDSVLEVRGGYAVEAYFGGQITRPHSDMDAVLWLRDASFEQEVSKRIQELLGAETTKWSQHPIEKEHFIEFREDAPEKPFHERRRLELYLFDKSRIRKLQSKILFDSQGQEHEVSVEPIEEKVADKIRIIKRNHDLGEEGRQAKGLREINETDRADLQRLLAHPEFSKDKYMQSMIGYLLYQSRGSISEEEARLEAEAQWNLAMQKIS